MLQAVLSEEQVGELAEGIREHYRKQDDGSFILDVGGVEGVELQDVAGMRSAMQKERTSRGSAERALKALKDQVGDLDLQAARDALVKIEELGDLDGEEVLKQKLGVAKAELERKFAKDKTSGDAAHAKAVGDLESDLKQRTAQLGTEMVGNRAAKAVAAAKGSTALLLPVIQQRARVVRQDDGSLDVRLFDASGAEMYTTRSGRSDPLTVEEFVESLRQDKAFAPAFEGSPAKGAGARRPGAGHPSGGVVKIDANDEDAKSAGLEDIASGKAVVVRDDAELGVPSNQR